MILLDTDHLTIVSFPSDAKHQTLIRRLEASDDEAVATTVISAEEQLRGWLAEINRRRRVRDQIAAYDRLADLVEFLSH